MSKWGASKSTILPLPSSPHCAPMIARFMSVWIKGRLWSGGYGVSSERPDVGGLKADHDIRFRNSRLFQFSREAMLGPVFLNYDFAVDNFDVDDERMDTPRAIPPFAKDKII